MTVSTFRTSALVILLGCAVGVSSGVDDAVAKAAAENCDSFPGSSDMFKRLCHVALELEENGRTNEGTGHDDASYSLGVRFYRTLAKDYSELSYLDFLTGILDARKGEVTISRSLVNSHLESAFMSRVIRSEQYLNKVVESESVTALQGIYFDKILAGTGNETQSLDRLPLEFKNACVTLKSSSCASTRDVIRSILRSDGGVNGSTEASSDVQKQLVALDKNEDSSPLCGGLGTNLTYSVAYARIDPIDSAIGDHLKKTKLHCINVERDEVIRGWRTALDKMSVNEIWDILVPSELAYGTEGVTGSGGALGAEPDETLRFVITLLKKPANPK